VTTKAGVSKIYFAELPKDVQRRFQYDAQKGATYTAEQNEKAAAYERQRLADSQKRLEERKQYWSEHATPAAQSASSTGGTANIQGDRRDATQNQQATSTIFERRPNRTGYPSNADASAI
jgi:hypothetical protein